MPETWYKLDPNRTDYGATYGARVRNRWGQWVTLLELPSGTVVIVGHVSCGNRESALAHADRCHNHDGDRRITKAQFDSWKAE